jgi:hypothetical protein
MQHMMNWPSGNLVQDPCACFLGSALSCDTHILIPQPCCCCCAAAVLLSCQKVLLSACVLLTETFTVGFGNSAGRPSRL